MLNPQIRMTLSGLALVLAVAAGNHGVGAAPPPRGIELAPLGVYRTGLYDEGAVEISAYDPTGAPLLLVSNEVSGSLRIFTISAAN